MGQFTKSQPHEEPAHLSLLLLERQRGYESLAGLVKCRFCLSGSGVAPEILHLRCHITYRGAWLVDHARNTEAPTARGILTVRDEAAPGSSPPYLAPCVYIPCVMLLLFP